MSSPIKNNKHDSGASGGLFPGGYSEEDLSSSLIQRARGGEAEALDQLISIWRTYLLHIANDELERDLQQKLGASDIVQNACIDVHTHFHEFRGESTGEWKAWLRQLLLRDLQDARRRFRKTAQRDVNRERRLYDSRDCPFEVAGENVSPRTELIAREESAVLRSALKRLSSEQRQVIRLRSWENLPFAEIGMQINRSTEASRKLWTRAVSQLQVELNHVMAEF